jgi:hypothetical protein
MKMFHSAGSTWVYYRETRRAECVIAN